SSPSGWLLLAIAAIPSKIWPLLAPRTLAIRPTVGGLWPPIAPRTLAIRPTVGGLWPRRSRGRAGRVLELSERGPGSPAGRCLGDLHARVVVRGLAAEIREARRDQRIRGVAVRGVPPPQPLREQADPLA